MVEIEANLIGNLIYSNSKKSYSFNEKNSFGEKRQDKIQYSIFEAFYLFEKKKMEILQKGKFIKKQDLLNKFQKIDKNFYTKYLVFENLRNKGYVVKNALKFGAEFRVYEKTKKEHAKWIVFVQKESDKSNWKEFASKNRVAHSTKKNLLLAIVGGEGSVIYYEIKWIKP